MQKGGFLMAYKTLYCLIAVASCVYADMAQHQEIPTVVQSGAFAIGYLRLNREGNVIRAAPGEKIFTTLNFSCDRQWIDPESLHQIVIGYQELGPQKCVFNEIGFRCSEGITSFFLEAPHEEGVYEIACYLDQADSPHKAMLHWWEEDTKPVIGKIIVESGALSRGSSFASQRQNP